MPDEKPIPLPLSGEEVQEAILYKVAESLSRTCHLKADNAYTSFKATISIKLELSDYGRIVPDNHLVKEHGEGVNLTESQIGPEYVEETTTTVEPAPPNQVRVETGQAVPVPVQEGGKRVIKNLKYAPRKSKSGQQG